MNNKKIALLAIVVGALISAGSAGFVKKGLFEVPAFSLVALRFVVAAICMLPFILQRRVLNLKLLKDIGPISLFATINVTFFVLGVKYTTANMGSVLYAAVPLLTGVVLYFISKENTIVKHFLGLILGFIGVLIIALLPMIEKGNPFAGGLVGNFLLLVAITSWSFYMALSKKLQKNYTPFELTSVFIIVSAVVLLPLLFLDAQSFPGWWQHVGMWGITSVLYMGIPVTIISYILNQYAIKHGGAVFAGTLFYLLPIFGVVINFLLLGEMVTLGFIMGSLLALLGTYLVVRR